MSGFNKYFWLELFEFLEPRLFEKHALTLPEILELYYHLSECHGQCLIHAILSVSLSSIIAIRSLRLVALASFRSLLDACYSQVDARCLVRLLLVLH